jgi:Ca2+-binding EF-hand superfamily protein
VFIDFDISRRAIICREVAKKMFYSLDASKAGFISVAQLEKALSTLQPENLAEAQINALNPQSIHS